MSRTAVVKTSRAAIVSGAFHHHLVDDEVRVDAYARAIRAAVRPGDVVADLGAGSGLLSGIAARAGASRVIALESEAHTFAHLERFVARNDLGDVVTPVRADAEEWTPVEHVDVVVCEMMETGLMNEDQVRVMNHVHRDWPEPPRVVVPQAASCRLVLAAAPAERHGFRVILPHFERAFPAEYEALSDEAEYLRADFTRPRAPRADDDVHLVGTHDAEANAVVLVTRTDLGNGIEAPPSPDHASPLVLPLDRPLPVRPGVGFLARVKYEMGSVTGSVHVDVQAVE